MNINYNIFKFEPPHFKAAYGPDDDHMMYMYDRIYCAQTKIENLVIIGASLSEPHIDHDNGPHTRNNGMSVFMYHLPHVCRTLVPEIRVCPEMLRVFRYIDVLTCVIYNLTERSSAVKIINEEASVQPDTWYCTAVLFIQAGATLNLLQCLCVICGCRA